jgi:multiple sugar transport system permease protein
MRRTTVLGRMRYVVLALALLIALFPVWWMVVTSLKRPVDIFSGVSLVPQHPTSTNYDRLFADYHMGSFLVNSVIVVLISVVVSLAIGTLAA